ncbi:MAG: GNAT family N-acetyltransferase [Clostridia bacterium]|nr:GNAT family N-acetyltransferase [Clostridia bacterium]
MKQVLYEARRFTLKDGREAVLRCPEPEDALNMVRYLTDTAAETEFVLRYPEECHWTEEQERNLLQGFKDNPNSLMLCCFVDGELAGNCNLQFNGQLKFRHKASVAIALYRKFWGLGIGTAMFGAMIDVARDRGMMQLELEYIGGNDRGRGLYEKMGFVEVARHPDAVRLKDGSFRDLIFMTKKL